MFSLAYANFIFMGFIMTFSGMHIMHFDCMFDYISSIGLSYLKGIFNLSKYIKLIVINTDIFI